MAEEQPGNGGQNEQGSEDGGTPEAPVSFDAWLQQQPETVRALADAQRAVFFEMAGQPGIGCTKMNEFIRRGGDKEKEELNRRFR